jgi:formylglycine-generating enzyme required for sulfatase activity
MLLRYVTSEQFPMTDPHSFERTQPIPPDNVVESAWRFLGERLLEQPDLDAEIRQYVEATLSLPPRGADAALADTVSIAGDSSHQPHVSKVGSSSFRRFGDYELIQEIARGGMGVVYKARQVSLDRTVALKMILAGQLADADDVRRFRTEAQAAANLDHPGIVPIHEIGEYQGQHFFSMGFVQGHSLAAELRDGPLPPRRAAEITRKVAEAIGYAHSRGVIHRDLKPSNVLVDTTGEPKVTDFGLAKRTDIDSQLTGTGQIMGTPAYMPPEQALGNVFEVREPADVYALGAMLYCLLTRRPPFQAANPIDTLRQVLETEALPIRKIDPSLPKDLETICLKCLRKDAKQRYSSAQLLADDLRRWLDGEPIQARPVSRAEKAWMWCKRKPVIAGLAAVIALGAIIGSAVFWERQQALRAAGLVESLAKAEPSQIPALTRELDQVRWWAEPRLRQQLATTGDSSVAKTTRLHARMALVGHDSSLVAPLQAEMLESHESYIGPLRMLLRPYASELTAEIGAILRSDHDSKVSAERRFRAALALADFVPATEVSFWTATDLRWIAEQLVSSNPEFQPLLREQLRPISERLLPELETTFSDPTASDAQRLSAANAIADYAASDIARLSKLLAIATPEQYAVLYPIVAASPAPSTIEDLGKIAATLPPAELGSVDRISFGQRRANAAVALLRLGERERVLPVFDWSDDPEALTQFIFRCKPRGIGVEPLLDLLDLVTTAPTGKFSNDARYALLLAIGEYAPTEIPAARREALVKRLADWYASDPSSGVHGASGWLLRHLGEKEIADRVDQTPIPYSPDREWFTLAITVTPTLPPNSSDQPTPDRAVTDPTAPPETLSDPLPQKTFYYTFSVFLAGDYEIGSPSDEPERENVETRHRVTLTRPFALLDREITFEELTAFSPPYAAFANQFGGRPEDAGFGVDWYDSVAFCRWLSRQAGISESDQAYADPESLDQELYRREPNPQANWAPRNWPLELDRRGFRLPTESEWEVANRSGARTAYGHGSDTAILDRFGWHLANSGKRGKPPRELRPGSRGLFDMHGNMFEWTHDWFDEFGEGALVDPVKSELSSDAIGPNRVLRGGGFGSDLMTSRTAYRFILAPTYRTNNLGLRLALSPSGVSSPAER